MSDIDTEAADSLKALDPKRPIREAGLGHPLHQIQDIALGNAAPFCDAGPALDAEMRRDLLLFRHRLELGQGEAPGSLDQTVEPQPVAGEFVRHQVVERLGVRHRAVRPEEG